MSDLARPETVRPEHPPSLPNLKRRLSSLSSFWQGWGQLILGALFSLAVIIWLAANLDLQQVVKTLRQVDYLWVGLGALAVVLTLAAKAMRWLALLHSDRVSTGATFKALILGVLLNQVFPARLGDLGRCYLIAQAGYPSKSQALGTIALEKLLDILVVVGLALGLSFWQPLPAWVSLPARLVALGGGLALLSSFTLLALRPRLELAGARRWPGSRGIRWLGQLAGRLLDGLAGLQRPRLMLAAGGWSLLAWLFGAVTNLALLQAFGLPASPGIALLLLVVLQLGVALPSLPGRVGVFEGLAILTLALFGVEPGPALGYGVLLHAVVLLPPVGLGLGWLLRLDAASRRMLWRLS
ncbi:MAG: lysylphosphatidylglycerol synthase transmembrane domain-containing protein [Anaerolineae bacterium]